MFFSSRHCFSASGQSASGGAAIGKGSRRVRAWVAAAAWPVRKGAAAQAAGVAWPSQAAGVSWPAGASWSGRRAGSGGVPGAMTEPGDFRIEVDWIKALCNMHRLYFISDQNHMFFFSEDC